MLSEIDIQPYITQLTDKIIAEVKDTRIVEAFRNVPRHRFVMQGFHVYDRESREMKHFTLEETDAKEWLSKVYDNAALQIQYDQPGAPSSSSEPVLMAVMLENLDIQAGMQVLEVGTGTGYNAALLAYLTGKSGRVDTIDNQPHLTERAEIVLKEIAGDTVHVHTGNGMVGLPDHAPYDRIIATAGHSKVPPALLEQLAVHGKLIMNIGRGGGLVVLEKTADKIQGHFLEQAGFFMPLRGLEGKEERLSGGIDLEDFKSLDFRFFMDWVLPVVSYSFGFGGSSIIYRSSDGEDIVTLSQNDEGVKAIYSPGDAVAEQIIDTIRKWYTMGKPKRGDYSFHVTNDGKQIIQIGDRPDMEIELSLDK